MARTISIDLRRLNRFRPKSQKSANGISQLGTLLKVLGADPVIERGLEVRLLSIEDLLFPGLLVFAPAEAVPCSFSAFVTSF